MRSRDSPKLIALIALLLSIIIMIAAPIQAFAAGPIRADLPNSALAAQVSGGAAILPMLGIDLALTPTEEASFTDTSTAVINDTGQIIVNEASISSSVPFVAAASPSGASAGMPTLLAILIVVVMLAALTILAIACVAAIYRRLGDKNLSWQPLRSVLTEPQSRGTKQIRFAKASYPTGRGLSNRFVQLIILTVRRIFADALFGSNTLAPISSSGA